MNEFVGIYLYPLIVLVQFLITIVSVWMNKSYVRLSAHGKLALRVDLIEAGLKDVPTSTVIGELKIQITRLEGKLETASTAFEGSKELADRLQTQVNRLEDFLKWGEK